MSKNNNMAVRMGTSTKIVPKPQTPTEFENRSYKLHRDMNGGFFLEDFEEFNLPSKIYGSDVSKITEKVFNTFKEADRNVGVLLSGMKGTGKSVQMKHIAVNADMPVIIVDQPFSGQALMDFCESLPRSCVFLFDEFEKTYRHREDQESILPLLDGMSTSKHIFVFTVNGKVSEFLIGRPSRIRYNKVYYGLSDEVILEILNDKLDDKNRIKEIAGFLSIYSNINMDTLCSLIEEVNIYPEESISEISEIFNVEDPFDASGFIITSFPMIVMRRPKEKEGKMQKMYASEMDEIYEEEVAMQGNLLSKLKSLSLPFCRDMSDFMNLSDSQKVLYRSSLVQVADAERNAEYYEQGYSHLVRNLRMLISDGDRYGLELSIDNKRLNPTEFYTNYFSENSWARIPMGGRESRNLRAVAMGGKSVKVIYGEDKSFIVELD